MNVKQIDDPERAARIQRAVDNCMQDVVKTTKKRAEIEKQELDGRRSVAAKTGWKTRREAEQNETQNKTAPRPMMVSNYRDPLGDVVFEMPIDDLVIVGHRKNFGDIKALAESIRSERLIFPIVLAPDYSVLSGERRIKALKSLGEKTVRVVVVADYDLARKRIVAERADGTSKPMVASEQMVLMKQLYGGGLTSAGRAKNIWDTLGFSSWGTYTRVRRVYDATTSENEELRALGLELMRKLDTNETRPSTARDAIVDYETNGSGARPKGQINARGQVTAIRNARLGLEGITTGLEIAFHGGFERSCTRAMAAEASAALAAYSGRLNRVARRLKAYSADDK